MADMFERQMRSRTVTVKSHTSRFGEVIRAGRERAGLTQAQLAKKLGLERTSVTNMEKGKQIPTLQKFVMLCRILKVTPNDVLGFK